MFRNIVVLVWVVCLGGCVTGDVRESRGGVEVCFFDMGRAMDACMSKAAFAGGRCVPVHERGLVYFQQREGDSVVYVYPVCRGAVP